MGTRTVAKKSLFLQILLDLRLLEPQFGNQIDIDTYEYDTIKNAIQGAHDRFDMTDTLVSQKTQLYKNKINELGVTSDYKVTYSIEL